MQISDITNQSGVVERIERRRRIPYGSSGDELREIHNDINSAMDELSPLLLMFNDHIRWDDVNHTKAPKGKFNLVANQNDYKLLKDSESTPVPILNITNVRILHTTGDTQYHDLELIPIDDARVPEILSPNTAITGTPTGYVELNNRIYLNVLPDTSITDGLYLFFQRQHQLVVPSGTSADITDELGIPVIFHELIAAIAAHYGNRIHRSDDSSLLSLEQTEIREKKADLESWIAVQHPTHARLQSSRESNK